MRPRQVPETRAQDTCLRHMPETHARDTRLRHAPETRTWDTYLRRVPETRAWDTCLRHAPETHDARHAAQELRTLCSRYPEVEQILVHFLFETRARDTYLRHMPETRARNTRLRHAPKGVSQRCSEGTKPNCRASPEIPQWWPVHRWWGVQGSSFLRRAGVSKTGGSASNVRWGSGDVILFECHNFGAINWRLFKDFGCFLETSGILLHFLKTSYRFLQSLGSLLASFSLNLKVQINGLSYSG